MVRKTTLVTTFIQDLSYLLDKKVEFSVEEVNTHIENENVLDWLELEFPPTAEISLDFSLLDRTNRDWFHENLEATWCAYAGQESRKWGIENNGLCLLISWSIEILRNLQLDE